MTKEELTKRLGKGTLILDGATGSNLMKAGMPKGICTEQWVAEHPNAIIELQKAYAEAGSDIVYAPTFMANPISLATHGLAAETERLNHTLVGLSRKAVGDQVLVAGDLTTTGKLMEPLFVKWRAFFHIEKDKKGFILFQRVRTFFLVMIGLVFFRSATVPDALRVLGRGVSGVGLQLFRDGVLSGLGLDWTELMILAVSILFSAWVTIHNQKEDMRVTLEKKPIWLRWIALYALLFYVILLGKYGPGYSASEFIYQNFKV